MSEDAQKRNTDCVYFLASPLTCKKGNDCEYRHSEVARVNPRDCWYWVSGNCLNNANCPFRHPPLDGKPITSVPTTGSNTGGTVATANGVASTSSIPSSPATTKQRVPCVFYSQGYCAKGGKCPFLHGPPTQFRKDATTYRKPHVNEQQQSVPEGNGPSVGKKYPQEGKALNIPAKHSEEFSALLSNTYRRPTAVIANSPASGKQLPPVTGDRIPGTSRPSKMQNMAEGSKQEKVDGKMVSSIQQVHNGNFRHILSRDKTLPIKLDRQNNVDRTESGLQDNMVELGTQSGRELHAGDLRNRLVKRRRNDNTHSTQSEAPQSKENVSTMSKAESKESVPVNKRTKQENDANFAGPKTLAQIKAEKMKARIDGASKNVDVPNGDKDKGHSSSVEPDVVSEQKVLSGIEIVHGAQSRNVANGVQSSASTSITQSFIDAELDQDSELHLDHHLRNHDSHEGFPSNLIRQHGHQETEVVKVSGSEETLGLGTAVNGVEITGNPLETDYMSADEVMGEGTEVADADYVSDEEDEFARKLGGFLS